ncbi:hypothetical protein BRADI_4g44330v3 [Brachypodium distachyon]|uniref:RING-type domain-containing protein n=1 Tax=Brachypodium distachyon TaxID=15368 RepID=I1IUZ8_BRADI|nr:hypothetical protein BRADI_4g44330v3 [Brachypodium distachyon]
MDPVVVVEPRLRRRRRELAPPLSYPPAPLPPPVPSPLSLTKEERAQDWVRFRLEADAAYKAELAEEAKRDPADAEAIVGMHVPAAGETSETECDICLGELFRDGGCEFKKRLRMMPCSHTFHQSCIWDWLLDDRRCPVCGYAMPSEKRRRVEEEEMDNQRLRLARVNIN